MNTKEQLEAQVKELENKLSEVKATINKMEEKKSCKRWRAENDGKFFVIGPDGYIQNRIEKGIVEDNKVYNMGNYYKTKEEAERARDLQLTVVRVNDAIDEANEGWVADYNNNDDKYIIYYNHYKSKYNIYIYCNLNYNYIIKECKSKQIAYKIIADYSEDLNLIFNVK